MTKKISTNTFIVSKFVVSSDPTQGTHTTIQSATNDASDGDVIFIREGTYTENLTLKPVNITYFGMGSNGRDVSKPVTIIGQATDGGLGVGTTFVGITIKTNSNYFLNSSGAGNIFYFNCDFICPDHSGFILSNGNGNVWFNSCTADIQTTGINFFNVTDGDIFIYSSQFFNSGASTTANSLTGGICKIRNSLINAPISVSNAASFVITNSTIDCLAINSTALTLTGSGSSSVTNSTLIGGTSTCASIGVGTTLTAANCTVDTTNTNVFVGAGTLNTGGNACTNTGHGNTVSVSNSLTII